MALVHANFGAVIAPGVVVVVVVAVDLTPLFHEDEVSDANICEDRTSAPVSLREFCSDGPESRPAARHRDQPILVLLVACAPANRSTDNGLFVESVRVGKLFCR
eukprot:8962650-Pyramimonas_sp.AAC.1